jgi:hypothetical protein
VHLAARDHRQSPERAPVDRARSGHQQDAELDFIARRAMNVPFKALPSRHAWLGPWRLCPASKHFPIGRLQKGYPKRSTSSRRRLGLISDCLLRTANLSRGFFTVISSSRLLAHPTTATKVFGKGARQFREALIAAWSESGRNFPIMAGWVCQFGGKAVFGVARHHVTSCSRDPHPVRGR